MIKAECKDKIVLISSRKMILTIDFLIIYKIKRQKRNI